MAKKTRRSKKRRALVVYGGWEGHEPKQCAKLFTPVLKKLGFEVTVEDNMDVYAKKTVMRRQHLVVPIWTMGGIEPEQKKGLLDAVANGCGIAGWHGGMGDSFRNDVDYQFMVGGQWVAHPGGIVKYRVDITDHTHPITEGVKPFEMESEQYYMHVDPGNTVLATTTFGDAVDPWIAGTHMPQVWIRNWGEGRVFYTALGHVAKDFKVKELKEIVTRGFEWAAKE